MAKMSNAQSNFLGGLWSKFAQGRFDHQRYKTALSECLNAYPTEEGAWTRRPGFRFCAFTRGGAAGRIIPFTFDETTPYDIELVASHIRLFSGYSLVINSAKVYTVSSISTASPAVVTTSATNTVATGDEVQFIFTTATALANPTISPTLKNRQFKATRLTTTTFSLVDSVTLANLDGSTINFDGTTVPTQVGVLIDLASPYVAAGSSPALTTVNIVRSDTDAVLLHAAWPPTKLTITPNLTTAYAAATASLVDPIIKDGPYLAPITGGAWAVPQLADDTKPNVVSLNINFPTYDANHSYNIGDLVQDGTGAYRSLQASNLNNTPASSATYWEVVDAGIINGEAGFTSGDIGRMVRLYSIPPLYDEATTYAKGDPVSLYDDVGKTYGFYVSTTDSNLANAPDGNTGLDNWLPTTSTDIARWTWGKLTAIGTGLNPRMVVTIYGDPLLYVQETHPAAKIYGIRMGVYGGGTGYGYPTCGVYHEGRLWLGGAVPNRFDSSNTNDFFNFAPTSPDGTVADNHAISATVNSSDVNQTYWMESTETGILIGTKGGEWRLMASNLDDPLTPSSIRARRVTKYGCANIPPVKAGFALLFVQRFQRAIYELLAEAFTSRIVGQNLSVLAKHLGKNSFQEITYQREQTPIVWARDGHGALFGCTYRRVSPSGSDEPTFYAWHRHVHGSGREFQSIGVGPSDSINVDMLSAVTKDNQDNSGYYAVEFMTPLFDEDASYTQGWHMDFATGAAGAVATTSAGVAGLRIYGLWPHNGTSPYFFLGGVNCGTFAVSGGNAFVPYGTYDGVTVNLAYIQSINTQYDAGTLAMGNAYNVVMSGSTPYDFPIVVGWPYTSRGQRLRPASAEDTGAQAGPGFAKTRRNHLAGFHLHNTASGKLRIGTDFTTMNAPTLTTTGGTAKTVAQLYSGVIRTSIADTYSLDGQIAWEITTPYPATVLAVGGFLATQDQ